MMIKFEGLAKKPLWALSKVCPGVTEKITKYATRIARIPTKHEPANF